MTEQGFREQPTNVQAKLLDGVAATGRTVRVPVHSNGKHSLQVLGTFVATIHLEASNKPDPDLATDADWITLGNVTAPGFIQAVDKNALWLTANVSAFTSGSIDAHVVSSPG